MNTSKLFKNAILNLYKEKIYTADFAIIKASDYADKNKITAEDYEELLTFLATEQENQMIDNIETAESMDTIEETTETTEVVE